MVIILPYLSYWEETISPENGKIVEMWGEFDCLGMLQQLGLMPMAG